MGEMHYIDALWHADAQILAAANRAHIALL